MHNIAAKTESTPSSKENTSAIARGSRALQQLIFSLLHRCNSYNKVSQIHTQILINGFSHKNFILVKLLSFYISSNILLALRLFHNMDNPSTTAWNQIIRSHVRGETPQKSVQFYNRMVAAEAEPDGFTYSFLLSGCARSGMLREGEQVHGRVLAKGFCSNVFVQTSLVNFYAMAGGSGGVGIAHKVFDEMHERNVASWNSLIAGFIRCGELDEAGRVFDEMPERNVVSWTTMIGGYAQQGKYEQALTLFNEMWRARVVLDQVALVTTLTVCAEIGDLKMGRWIHSNISKTLSVVNQPPLVSLNNALIHMYASCGVIEDAFKVFKAMKQRSTVSWTSMIMGFAKQGCAEQALDVFQWMQTLEVKEERPDEITLIGVLCACSHGGFVNEGRYYFECMTKRWKIKPRIEHYGCVIDLLSRAGFLDEARDLIETMPMKPNDVVWGALLGGCRIHKNAELASHVAEKLKSELDPNQAAGYFVLLSNVYATSKRWHDAATVRQKMGEMGVQKPPGWSLVQIG